MPASTPPLPPPSRRRYPAAIASTGGRCGHRPARSRNRRLLHSRREPHRGGRQGLLLNQGKPESGTRAGGGGSHRDRARCAGPRGALRPGPRGFRPADRPEPGDPASARGMLDGARIRLADDAKGGLAPRHRPALRGGGECGETAGWPCGTRCLPAGGADPGRHGPCQGIRGGAPAAREPDLRIAPVAEQMVLSFIAEHVLGQPRSC